MITAKIRGEARYRFAAVFESLQSFRFGADVRALADDLRDSAGLDVHPKTIERDLRMLRGMGLAKRRGLRGCRRWFVAVRKRSKAAPAPVAAPVPPVPVVVPPQPAPCVESVQFVPRWRSSLDAARGDVLTAWERLSLRQQAIIRELAAGRSSAEIGERLGMATTTVETHRSRIRRRLGLTSGDALMRFAILATSNPEWPPKT